MGCVYGDICVLWAVYMVIYVYYGCGYGDICVLWAVYMVIYVYYRLCVWGYMCIMGCVYGDICVLWAVYMGIYVYYGVCIWGYMCIMGGVFEKRVLSLYRSSTCITCVYNVYVTTGLLYYTCILCHNRPYGICI